MNSRLCTSIHHTTQQKIRPPYCMYTVGQYTLGCALMIAAQLHDAEHEENKTVGNWRLEVGKIFAELQDAHQETIFSLGQLRKNGGGGNVAGRSTGMGSMFPQMSLHMVCERQWHVFSMVEGCIAGLHVVCRKTRTRYRTWIVRVTVVHHTPFRPVLVYFCPTVSIYVCLWQT